MPTRVIMLVDLDYFFAQCEELRNPSLRDKPVVVGVYSGRTEESGAVSTANYIARGYGVKSGMPIYQAKKKLETVDSVFLPVDDLFYEQISAKVMNLLRGFADEFEEVGIDEAYLDVTTRTLGNFQNARYLAERIRSELKAKLNLTCSIGVGPNKLVAKIAADQNKPDGLTVIMPDQVSNFLEPLPVKRLIGVGVKTAERMKSMNIHTVGDLARFNGQTLVETFGRALGTYFHNASIGIDNEPVHEKGEAESISRIATLKQATNDLNTIFEKADQLCSDLHMAIMEKQVSFKTVSIIAIATDLTTHTRAKTFETPSTSLELMKQTARGLFERFQAETACEIRRVGVKVSSLTPIEKHQKQITHFIKDA